MDSNNLQTEIWLLGPIANVPELLQPVAHALLQARKEIIFITQDFDTTLLWKKTEGLASPGFHLQHVSGVLDRLFTYAKGGQLTETQLQILLSENNLSQQQLTLPILICQFNNQVDKALTQLGETEPTTLTSKKFVGRKLIATTQMGLFVHAAEHIMRHVGQLMVTIKFLQYQQKL